MDFTLLAKELGIAPGVPTMKGAYGGAQSTGGTSGNRINGISPKNKNRERYINAAKKEFKDL